MTRRELEDERSFLLRSLRDLEREHEAGDLSDEDHAVLRDGYTARAAAVLTSLDGGSMSAAAGTEPRRETRRPRAVSPDAPRRRRHRLVVTAVSVAVTAGAVWAVVAHVGPRLPGDSATGSVTLSSTEQVARTLAQAETDESRGDPVDAVRLYRSVLRQDPSQEQALAEVGWLEYEAGAQARQGALLALGEREEWRAEGLAPGDYAPHLYLGSMLLAQGDASGAVGQYRQFLADHPPRSRVVSAVPFLTRAFAEAHVAPPALPVGAASAGG